ncbi:MAG: thiamine phosphate synthase [Halobacteriota archaeon]
MNSPDWRTYLLTEQSLSAGRSTLEIVRAAIDGGIDVVQLREKGLDSRRRYELGLQLRQLTDRAGIDLLVNDRIDIAQAIDADGVHLGQTDLPVAVARSILGPDAIVGCSASTVDEATSAAAEGADYLGVGAVYGTTSKDVDGDRDGIGLDRIAAVSEAVDVPVVGIGGITPSNAGAVVDAGAQAVAVVSAIAAAVDPTGATSGLVESVSEVAGDD